jgi:hypothetical protein
MVLKFDDVRVVMGRLIRVWNTKRKAFSNAKKWYYAVQIEDADGTNERCLLFTEKEIKRAEYRAKRNPEDLPDKSWWTDIID